MAYVPTLKTQYKEQIVAALMKEFGYSSVMQCPKLTKIVINQGMGQAVADKKLIDVAEAELTQITGQKAVQTRSRKDMWLVKALSSTCSLYSSGPTTSFMWSLPSSPSSRREAQNLAVSRMSS